MHAHCVTLEVCVEVLEQDEDATPEEIDETLALLKYDPLLRH